MVKGKEPDHRNIRLQVDTIGRLKRFGKMGESYDDVITRLFHELDFAEGVASGQVTFFDFLTIDGDLPQKHKVVYMLGNAKHQYVNGKDLILEIVKPDELK